MFIFVEDPTAAERINAAGDTCGAIYSGLARVVGGPGDRCATQREGVGQARCWYPGTVVRAGEGQR